MVEAKHMTTDVETANDDGFDAGFNDEAQTPTATPGSGNADQPSAAQAISEAVEYVQLTRAEHDDLKGLKATADRSFGTAFGKIGGIERKLAELSTGPTADVSQEDIDALKEDFPPLANALEKIRSMRVIHGAGADPDNIDRLVQAKVGEVKQDFERRFLGMQHPDWQTVTVTPEFATWKQNQAADFQAELDNSWDSSFIAGALTQFKAQRKAASDTAATRRSRINAAVTPRGSGQAPTATDLDEFESGFEGQ